MQRKNKLANIAENKVTPFLNAGLYNPKTKQGQNIEHNNMKQENRWYPQIKSQKQVHILILSKDQIITRTSFAQSLLQKTNK